MDHALTILATPDACNRVEHGRQRKADSGFRRAPFTVEGDVSTGP